MLLKSLRSRLLTMLPNRPRTIRHAPLRVESLDGRDLPAVTFPAIDDVSFPAGKDLFVPLSAVDPENPNIVYVAQSNNAQVSAQVLSNTTNIVFNVSGKDGDGNDFSGAITLTLFNDLAPLAAARIAQLADSGFYDGRNFHRVIDGFMAQAGSVNGSGSGDSGLGKFADEYQPTVAFTSRGLVALANAGDDTNDTQFFIVDTDLSLAQMPQHLNFNHTIVGQLTGGFEVFAKLMSTDTEAQNPPFNNEDSKPTPEIIISSAQSDSNSQARVLRISAPANFTGSSEITVTANSSGGATPDSASEVFTVTGVADTINDRAFLGPIDDITTSLNSSVTIDLAATDLESDPLTFVVRHPDNFSNNPANVVVTINQATRQATITPIAGFTGTVDLMFGVRDQTSRAFDQFGALLPVDAESNFDTQIVRLTVTNEITLDAGSQNGLYTDDNFTSNATPSLTIQTEAGRTVTVSVNGAGAFVATESSTPGRYTLTLPAGQLKVGQNVITAVVTGGAEPITLAPLTITYAPPINQGVYVVPGTIGAAQNLTVNLIGSQAGFRSEIGFFKVDDLSGKIGTLSPGDAGYAQAAIARAVAAMTRDKVAGATSSHTLNGGDIVGFYLIQNATSTTWLTANPNNVVGGSQPVAFFSFTAANPDGVNHVRIHGDADGRMKIGFEDLVGGGDRDYNDRVITIGPAGSGNAGASVQTPAGAARAVSAQFQLLPARRLNGTPTTTTSGEVGFFIVDGPDGRIGHLLPSDAGYAEAALGRRQQIFAAGAAVNTGSTATIQGGTLFGFYFIDSGSAATFLASNPSNSSTGTVRAFFSFAAANPDDAEHFRLFNPEGITSDIPTAGDPLRIHATKTLNPTESAFDDLLFTVNFASTGALPPFITSVDLTPNDPGTHETVTATVVAGDPDGGAPTLTYVWKVDGKIVRTQTTSSATDTLNLALAGNGDRGQEVTVEVTASDGINTSPMMSDSVTIGNASPLVEVAITPAGDIFASSVLTATVNASDPDGDAFTLRYIWRVEGRPDPVRESGTTTDQADVLDLATVPNLQPGNIITVEVIGTDADGDGDPGTAQRTIANRAPVGTLSDSSFSGSGTFTFDAAPSFSDPDGQTLTFTSELADGSPLPTWLGISAAGVLSGNPPASAAGVIEIKVIASDGDLTGFDTFTLSLSDTNDTPNGTLTLSPKPAGVEAILTASVTDVADDDEDQVDVTIEWRKNNVTIAGESGNQIDLGAIAGGVVVGDVISVHVTLDDGTETVTLSDSVTLV